MTDDIKQYLHAMDWPEPRANLSQRILDRIDEIDDDVAITPWLWAVTPSARIGITLGLVLCLAAGAVIGPRLMDQQNLVAHAGWPVTSASLAYMLEG